MISAFIIKFLSVPVTIYLSLYRLNLILHGQVIQHVVNVIFLKRKGKENASNFMKTTSITPNRHNTSYIF